MAPTWTGPGLLFLVITVRVFDTEIKQKTQYYSLYVKSKSS